MVRSKSSQYQLTDTGEFIIADYNSTKLFSSFFPGIAGTNGIPMWLFYVNRGQCVCSMGIQDKDHPIMEFLSANWAYNLVSNQGFRTFIKLFDRGTTTFYEPFQDHLRDRQVQRTQRMTIAPARLTLEEANETLGLRFSVDYFNVPEDIYAGLVRTLRIQNLRPQTLTLEGLDGLPLIIPYGVDNHNLKQMRRLVEAFVEVSNYDNLAPFFRGKVEPADRPDVVRIKQGNFYIGFEFRESGSNLLLPIVDPARIFGIRGDYSYPEKFLTHSPEELTSGQIFENRLPCAMGGFRASIPAGETYTYTSIIGHASSLEELNTLVPIISKKEYVESKAEKNQEVIKALTQNNFICSEEPVLNHYARQNFLDNTLRGGFPLTLHGMEARATLHVYSRKHGDLERDYNDFRLKATPYSQGNGNFRDINQNRRSDLLFNPDIEAGNVEHFYNLIQLDGYNPLVKKESRFKVDKPEELASFLAKYLGPEDVESARGMLQETFVPGELLVSLRQNQIGLQINTEVFLADLLGICNRIYDTDYGEGFWTDHWTYNLDLLLNFLSVYPEKLRSLLFEKKVFTYFDSPYCVQPRDEKYVVWEGKPMQLNAVVFDEEKETLITQRQEDPNRVRTNFGKGSVYYTSLINKILCLIVNKLASLDPEGVGVEMEAGKPDWYDALNGLPGLLGSSISETLEIKRHILFVLETFRECDGEIKELQLFEELKEFMARLHALLLRQLPPMEFWDKATTAKEYYRSRTQFGISGKEELVAVDEVREFLLAGQRKLEEGINKAWGKESNIISTYFINEVVEYQKIELPAAGGEKKVKCNDKGLPCFGAKKFKHIPLPLFLEGPVHYLRCDPDKEKAKTLVKNIRKSALYDSNLKMYKVNASLVDQPMEIGRARVFSPGWFENESIWLHMEYKYMLELLRNGLYTEFYQDFKNVFVPFFNPEIYGRSILENSSFIVSSANPDPSIHGNGFVARLSGATAEFIHILLFMMVGPKPFRINQEGELQLRFTPALAGWLFTQEIRKTRLFRENQWQEVEFPANTFSFMFLGNIVVTYHNQSRKDTYGPNGVSPALWKVMDLAGHSHVFTDDLLHGDIVSMIRDRKVSRIDIELK